MTTLNWREGQYTSSHGYAGPLHVFTISWKTLREDPNWIMACSLPGLEGKRWKHDDREALRERAGRILADWLQQVFGIRPNDPEYADPAFEFYADVAELGHDIRPLMHEAFDAGWLARAGETQ